MNIHAHTYVFTWGDTCVLHVHRHMYVTTMRQT